MTVSIYTESELATRFEDHLTDEVPSLTNFVEGSFDDDYTDALADYASEFEHRLVAVQLSFWAETSGGPLTEQKLEIVGYDPTRFDIATLERHTSRSDLDNLAQLNNVERDAGEFALGEVLFTTNTPDTEIPAGTTVTTGALPDGTVYRFDTTETVSPAPNATVVTAPIRALQRGDEHNVGSDSITEFYDRPTGVETVTNPDATAGGEDEESQASLRERTRTALSRSSGGGTVAGIEGGIANALPDVDPDDAFLIEHHDPSVPPYQDRPDAPTSATGWGELVVDTEQPWEEVIDLVHGDTLAAATFWITPVQPVTEAVDVSATLRTETAEVDPTPAENGVADYMSGLGLGANLRNGRLIQRIMNTDERIVDVDALSITVRGEVHTYQPGTDVYALDNEAAVDGVERVAGVSGGAQTTFDRGTDYAAADDNSDGYPNTIDFSVGGASPDDNTEFTANYQVANDVAADARAKITAGEVVFDTALAED